MAEENNTKDPEWQKHAKGNFTTNVEPECCKTGQLRFALNHACMSLVIEREEVLVVALVIGCIYWYWSSHLVVLHPLISIFLYAYLDCKN